MDSLNTVAEFVELLEKHPHHLPITFGSSKYRKRPLVFYRTKLRGKRHIDIELSELDDSDTPNCEHERRITVGNLIEKLSQCHDYELTFSGCLDASPLEFVGMEQALSINLDQPQKPEWRVVEPK